MIRDRLEEIPAGTRLLREIRHLPDDQLADLTVDELEHAERWLRAASYSAIEGARRLERHRNQRTEPCSDSSPASTPPDPSTSTLTPPKTDTSG